MKFLSFETCQRFLTTSTCDIHFVPHTSCRTLESTSKVFKIFKKDEYMLCFIALKKSTVLPCVSFHDCMVVRVRVCSADSELVLEVERFHKDLIRKEVLVSICRMQKLTFASPHVRTALYSIMCVNAESQLFFLHSSPRQMQKIENTDRQTDRHFSLHLRMPRYLPPVLQVWRQKFNYLFRKMQATGKQLGKKGNG